LKDKAEKKRIHEQEEKAVSKIMEETRKAEAETGAAEMEDEAEA
jgi:hypothetical protein